MLNEIQAGQKESVQYWLSGAESISPPPSSMIIRAWVHSIKIGINWDLLKSDRVRRFSQYCYWSTNSFRSHDEQAKLISRNSRVRVVVNYSWRWFNVIAHCVVVNYADTVGKFFFFLHYCSKIACWRGHMHELLTFQLDIFAKTKKLEKWCTPLR